MAECSARWAPTCTGPRTGEHTRSSPGPQTGLAPRLFDSSTPSELGEQRPGYVLTQGPSPASPRPQADSAWAGRTRRPASARPRRLRRQRPDTLRDLMSGGTLRPDGSTGSSTTPGLPGDVNTPSSPDRPFPKEGGDEPAPEGPAPTYPDQQKPDHRGPMSPELRDSVQQVPLRVRLEVKTAMGHLGLLIPATKQNRHLALGRTFRPSGAARWRASARTGEPGHPGHPGLRRGQGHQPRGTADRPRDGLERRRCA